MLNHRYALTGIGRSFRNYARTVWTRARHSIRAVLNRRRMVQRMAQLPWKLVADDPRVGGLGAVKRQVITGNPPLPQEAYPGGALGAAAAP